MSFMQPQDMAAAEHTQSDDAELGWYVAYTQSRREQVAKVNMEQQGFDSYLPLYKTFKKSPAGALAVFQPMFPRYVFFRPVKARQSISGARSTRGVSFVLSFGFRLAVLKPETLQAIRVCEGERSRAGLAEISPFRPGLRARVRSGGLRGLEGLIQSVAGQRVTLLLELLGRENSVSISPNQIELA